jgi:hypothetical protein
MQQPSLFDTMPSPGRDPPRARREDPATSQLAAARAGTFAPKHRDVILAALAMPGTIKEIAQRTGIDHVAVARRMSEIERAGDAKPTDEVRAGCRVWTRCS